MAKYGDSTASRIHVGDTVNLFYNETAFDTKFKFTIHNGKVLNPAQQVFVADGFGGGLNRGILVEYINMDKETHTACIPYKYLVKIERKYLDTVVTQVEKIEVI